MRQREDEQLKPLIRSIFREHRRRYGARRISVVLGERGFCCSRFRTKRLMTEMDLVAIQPRSFKPRTTESRHTLGYNENLLLETPPPNGINQLWVGDITYVPLVGSGVFLYLAILMDQYSRRIVGWDIQGHMQEPLVLSALRAAVVSRSPQRWESDNLTHLRSDNESHWLTAARAYFLFQVVLTHSTQRVAQNYLEDRRGDLNGVM
jgi:transposase InsO family protein